MLVNPAMQVVLRISGSARPKNRNQRKSALLEYMHWDLMMPPLKKTKQKKKHVLQIKEIHFDLRFLQVFFHRQTFVALHTA